MKALLCSEYGPPSSLRVSEVPALVPGAGQVVVSVKAAGLNFPDTLIIENKYQFKPELPFSPGSELAGVIARAGPDVPQFQPGQRVIAMVNWGAFAEECVVDTSRLIALPENMDFTTGAAFMLTYGTTLHGLRDRAELQTGETLLVLGAAGGVGTSAIEIGKLMGARVIAAASNDDKLALCRSLGADETINYASEDLRARLKDITGGKGPDVIYDPVGGPYSEPALRSIAWKGRHLVVGFAAGEIPRIPLNLILLKGCAIVGVSWGNFVTREAVRNKANIEQLLQWFAEGKLKPVVSATFALADAPRAMEKMLKREVRGKVVILPGA